MNDQEQSEQKGLKVCQEQKEHHFIFPDEKYGKKKLTIKEKLPGVFISRKEKFNPFRNAQKMHLHTIFHQGKGKCILNIAINGATLHAMDKQKITNHEAAV